MNLFIIEMAAATAGGFALVAATGGEMNDSQIFGYCALGSVAGSFWHILRAKLYDQDGMIFTFLLNALLAGFVGPTLCDYLPNVWLAINGKNCALLAFVLAASAPWFLTVIFPILGKKLAGSVRGSNMRSLIARVFKFKE